jgi:hypothetical protein
MKKIVQEVEGEGLLALLGKRVMVWCGVYIYEGKLTGVNTHDILLEDASVVYETGSLTGKPKNTEKLPNNLYLRTQAIECYYESVTNE